MSLSWLSHPDESGELRCLIAPWKAGQQREREPYECRLMISNFSVRLCSVASRRPAPHCSALTDMSLPCDATRPENALGLSRRGATTQGVRGVDGDIIFSRCNPGRTRVRRKLVDVVTKSCEHGALRLALERAGQSLQPPTWLRCLSAASGRPCSVETPPISLPSREALRRIIIDAPKPIRPNRWTSPRVVLSDGSGTVGRRRRTCCAAIMPHSMESFDCV